MTDLPTREEIDDFKAEQKVITAYIDGVLMTREEWVKDGWLRPASPIRPTYYQTSDGIDPENVLIDWLVEHGVDKQNAYNISHHLVHSVLYSVGRAVKCAVLDAAVGEEEQ